MGSDDPTNVKLKVTWTKEQLKNAPDFQYQQAAATYDVRAGGLRPTGMAPRPQTPPMAPRVSIEADGDG